MAHRYEYSTQTVTTQPGTTVVVGQTGTYRTERAWSTELCACSSDITICLCGCFIPVCLAMKVSQDMGENICVPCCVPGAMTALRTKIRTQEAIQGSICHDCLMETFCGPCALCQLAREVKMIREHTGGMVMTRK